MADYLMRDDAPIGADVWAKIDDMVMTVAGKLLVGRRLLSMVGPLGWGVEQAPLFGFEKQGDAAVAKAAKYVALGELSQEFVLRAKQLVMAEQTSFALDLGAVAIAATALAKAEDKAIVGGLLKQATPAALGDWGVMGGPFAAVADAVAGLRLAGFDPPYTLVLGPALFAKLASLMHTGRREIETVRELVAGGILQWADMPADQALVVSAASWNVDMVVGQDIATAWLGNDGLDQLFRIFETVALRVKRPGAACVLK
jgi:uncharacterized linocin/CFP29 family protein